MTDDLRPDIDMPDPADPPSPLTAKERSDPAQFIAIARRLHLAEHQCDGNCGQQMLRGDGVEGRLYALGVRVLSLAPSPAPAGLDERVLGALRDAAEQAHGFMHYGPFTDCEAAICVRRFELSRAVLASPAKAGLDVERLRVAMTTFVRHRRPNVSANGFTEALEAPSPEEAAAEYDRLTRAATRPAEDEQ